MSKSANWFPSRVSTAKRLEFALGLEHCASFSPKKDQNNHQNLLKEITAIRKLGRYEESSFAKISPCHRRALDFYQTDTSSEEMKSENTTSEGGGKTIAKVPQSLTLITQSKPCHYEKDEPGYISWTDHGYWRSLFDPYTSLVSVPNTIV